MHTTLNFYGKPVAISLSERATAHSKQLTNTLIIEIQVYFSCMLGKRLAYYSDTDMQGTWKLEPDEFQTLLASSQKLTDNIYLRFNTVMTKSCAVSDYAGPPPVTDIVIKNQKPYVPSWLKIDLDDNLWCGEFGWASSEESFSNTKQVRADAIRKTG